MVTVVTPEKWRDVAELVEDLDHDEVFEVAGLLRRRLGQFIDQADAIGDGPMVNALCAEARKYFSPGLRW